MVKYFVCVWVYISLARAGFMFATLHWNKQRMQSDETVICISN